MRKPIKIICIALIAALLIAAGLYFIPLKTNLNLKMYAVEVDNGEIYSGSEIKVTGSIKEYLFQSSQMNVNISLGDIRLEYQEKIEVKLHWPKGKTSSPHPYYMASYTCFSGAKNHFVHGNFGMSHDLDWLVLMYPDENDKYLVASTDPDFDPNVVLEAFHQVIYIHNGNHEG